MGDSPLERWHRDFLTKTNAELTIEDIVIAIRQNIEMDRVLPLATELFRRNPLSGEKYDGELFFALIEVDINRWKLDATIFDALKKFANETLCCEDVNGQVRIKSWFEKIEKFERGEI